MNSATKMQGPRPLCNVAFIYTKMMLKVPKREIFHRSNFPDFYAIKSSWVCDLVVKILTIILIFEGAKPHLVSGAHAEHTRKELMRVLSMHIRT